MSDTTKCPKCNSPVRHEMDFGIQWECGTQYGEAGAKETWGCNRIAEITQQLAAVTAERDAAKNIWSVDSMTAQLTAERQSHAATKAELAECKANLAEVRESSEEYVCRMEQRAALASRQWLTVCDELTKVKAENAELRAKLAEHNRHPGFRCPSCNGTFFGRDVTKDAEGNPQCLPTVQCHDEFGVKCKWHGVWPEIAISQISDSDGE
jgi:hypothetical protein